MSAAKLSSHRPDLALALDHVFAEPVDCPYTETLADDLTLAWYA